MHTTPSYPSADDIRYAVWLKDLALRLPAYATRYELTAAKVLQLHCVALDFIDLLIHRMHVATGSIRLRQCLAASEVPVVEGICWDTCLSLMQLLVEQIVSHIQQHPAYSAADAHELRLPMPT